MYLHDHDFSSCSGNQKKIEFSEEILTSMLNVIIDIMSEDVLVKNEQYCIAKEDYEGACLYRDELKKRKDIIK